MTDGEIVYLEVGRRKRIHKAARVGSMLLTGEGCNLDQSGVRREVDLAYVMEAGRLRACRRCFRVG